jgi:hypothetical protein
VCGPPPPLIQPLSLLLSAYVCPESLSACRLATSPTPDPPPHACQLMHYAYLSPWQACFIGSCGRAATPASRAPLERLRLNMAGGRWQRMGGIHNSEPGSGGLPLTWSCNEVRFLGGGRGALPLRGNSRGALAASRTLTPSPRSLSACPHTCLSMRYHGPCCSWPLPTCLPADTARILARWTGPNRWEPRMGGHRSEPSDANALWSMRGP